jgi:pimeloyl-ACP methyl ester carboxylesterase
MSAQLLKLGADTISYLEAGQGPVLVLLHGIGSAARSFTEQLSGLADGYRVIAWDAPGYGDSSCLRAECPSAGDYAAALAGFLDTLEIRSCHLLGHSLGSLMAARFAADHADRVVSLTLSSIAIGHGELPEGDRRKMLEQRLEDVATLGPQGMAERRGPRLLGPDATPAMVRRVVDTMAAINPAGYAQAARMLSTGNIKADVSRLPETLPLQIVYGDADVITPPARNQEVAALQPQAPVHVIPDAGHALYLEKPERFNAILRDFLR